MVIKPIKYFAWGKHLKAIEASAQVGSPNLIEMKRAVTMCFQYCGIGGFRHSASLSHFPESCFLVVSYGFPLFRFWRGCDCGETTDRQRVLSTHCCPMPTSRIGQQKLMQYHFQAFTFGCRCRAKKT